MNEDTRDVLIDDNHQSARSTAAEDHLARLIPRQHAVRRRLGTLLINLGERIVGTRAAPVGL